MSRPQDIIRYYSSEGLDDRGRRLADIQGWNDNSLEAVHDFIQWMFPLRERSSANPTAPTLDDAAIQQFRSRPDLQANLRLSLARMLKFYGFEIQYGRETILTRSPAFPERAKEWLSPHNHNYLRITRILKSLTELGLEEDARKFFESLSVIYYAQDKSDPLNFG